MDEEEKRVRNRARGELLACLSRLARWKKNDAVKLLFLKQEELDRVDGMDLLGVKEIKRAGNGALEIKLVDQLEVLGMLRQLQEEKESGLEGFAAALRGPEDGDAQ